MMSDSLIAGQQRRCVIVDADWTHEFNKQPTAAQELQQENRLPGLPFQLSSMAATVLLGSAASHRHDRADQLRPTGGDRGHPDSAVRFVWSARWVWWWIMDSVIGIEQFNRLSVDEVVRLVEPAVRNYILPSS